MNLKFWIQNYFDCSHFYLYILFHVYVSDSFKACQLLYFNWKIDVLRFVNTCLNGFCAIFHFLSWHLSSAKWKIPTILTYNLSIISLFWLRGIISLHSLIADPDYWLWSLFYLLASCCFHLNHDSFYPFRWFDNFWCFLFGSAWLTSSVWSCDVRFSERHCHFDATLLLEDLFFSTVTDSGSSHSPITKTSKERSPVVRLLEEPLTSKSLDVLDFALVSSLAGIGFDRISSLAAGGVLRLEIDPAISMPTFSVLD